MYASKFSELESIILNPVDYAKAVKVIANIDDITRVVDNLGWLPNQTIMSVTVSFSASSGKALTEKELKDVHGFADEILQLENSKQRMLTYLERRMTLIAPNVSAIVGTRVASKLIASAGGIQELSRIPACNIQVLGSQKKALNGMSTA
jgi:U4/U6 small nuclear ribonucleoprotein PRP31